MKRLITLLLILLILFLGGLAVLILQRSPEDLRGYLIEKTKKESGYHLKIEGSLRWHLWPKPSLLINRIFLYSPGVDAPIISAENMRLDIALLPLFSRQINVTEIMLKNAVVRLSPANMTSTDQPRDSLISLLMQSWTLDITKLRIADGLIIWQQKDGEEVNFRNLALTFIQKGRKHATLDLDMQVNRNQHQLALSFNAALNANDHTDDLSAQIDQLRWILQAPNLPPKGIKGTASLDAHWSPSYLTLNNLNFSLGDDRFSGSIQAHMIKNERVWHAHLHSARFDFDALSSGNAENKDRQTYTEKKMSPVVLGDSDNPLSNLLKKITLSLALELDEFRWRELRLQQVSVNADNRKGLIRLDTLFGQIENGSINLPGSIDVRSSTTKVSLSPKLRNAPLPPLLRALSLPVPLDGSLTLNGTFEGNGLSIDAIHQNWQGAANIHLTDGRIAQFNIGEMIEDIVRRNNNTVQIKGITPEETYLQNMEASVTLQEGQLVLSNIQSYTSQFQLNGTAHVNMISKECDINLGIQITKNWNNNNRIASVLQKNPVPLRIYGKWNDLKYDLQLAPLLQKFLHDELEPRRRYSQNSLN